MKRVRRTIVVTGLQAALAALGAMCTSQAGAENIDPDDDDSQYAYGENVGWLNGEPAVGGNPGVAVGDFRVTGWMYGENAGWVSLSCENTSSCEAVDYRIFNDGLGTLTGHAWSENLGWIRFDPVGGGVTIDATTGDFSGRAWGENVGWISFASSYHVMRTSWTCTAAGPPSDPTELTMAKVGGVPQLDWSGDPSASAFDAIEGDLIALRSNGGDFATAATGCLADKTTETSLSLPGGSAPGDGGFYLVRAANCRGIASYDSGGAGQAASRDAGIDGSAASCP